MSRRDSCTACTFIKNGVKTRKAIPHTCGKSDVAYKEVDEDKYAKGELSDEQIKAMSDELGKVIEKTDKFLDEIKRNTRTPKTRK